MRGSAGTASRTRARIAPGIVEVGDAVIVVMKSVGFGSPRRYAGTVTLVSGRGIKLDSMQTQGCRKIPNPECAACRRIADCQCQFRSCYHCRENRDVCQCRWVQEYSEVIARAITWSAISSFVFCGSVEEAALNRMESWVLSA